jgi:hypothetical protein
MCGCLWRRAGGDDGGGVLMIISGGADVSNVSMSLSTVNATGNTAAGEGVVCAVLRCDGRHVNDLERIVAWW